MAFRELSALEQRVALLHDYETGASTVVDLCARYGISRETFYIWQRRRAAGGERWFEELSRAPGSCPHTTPPETIAAITAIRARFPPLDPRRSGRA